MLSEVILTTIRMKAASQVIMNLLLKINNITRNTMFCFISKVYSSGALIQL